MQPGDGSELDAPTAEEAVAAADDARQSYALTADPGWLDQAIVALEFALAAGAAEPTILRKRLGSTLVERYRRTGDLNSLERGLREQMEVLQATPADDPERADRLTDIANALLMAVERIQPGEGPAIVSSHLQLIDGWLAEATQLLGEDPWRRSSLATARRLRFEHFGDAADLDEAIGLLDDVVARFGPERTSAERAAWYGNLAVALARRHEHGGGRGDLDRAIEAWRAAADAAEPGSRDHAAHLQNLALGLQMAKDDAAAERAFEQAAATPSDPSLVDAHFWSEQAARSARSGEWSRAVDQLETAQRKLERLIEAEPRRELRERTLGHFTQLAGELAYARAQLGDAEGAMAALEQGRGRLFAELLTLRRFETGDEVAPELSEAARSVREFEADALSPTSAAGVIGGERQRIERQRLERLRREAEPVDSIPRLRTSLVYVAAADAGGLAVVAPAAGAVTTCALPGLDRAALVATAASLLEARSNRRADPEQWLQTLDHASRWLWDAAMGPLLDGPLAELPELVLVPCGLLGLLPLHAAWTPDPARPTGRRYALDAATICYGPSARMLAEAERVAAGQPFANATIVAGPEPPPEGVDPLPGAQDEAETVAGLLPSARSLLGTDATHDAVLSAFRESSLVHLACHATSAPGAPLRSALLLAGGTPLEVHELMVETLPDTRLVVLSACETGVVGLAMPDEAVSLPAALLAAGAGGVVGSLWTVPDRSTALLMGDFYRRATTGGQSPPAALGEAQRWLRDVTNDDLVARGLATAPASTSEAARQFWGRARPYAHPHHWAAFGYTGC